MMGQMGAETSPSDNAAAPSPLEPNTVTEPAARELPIAAPAKAVAPRLRMPRGFPLPLLQDLADRPTWQQLLRTLEELD